MLKEAFDDFKKATVAVKVLFILVIVLLLGLGAVHAGIVQLPWGTHTSHHHQ